MSNWNSFSKLATLDISYGNIAPDVTPQIYANSRNQVEIIISVKVIEKEKEKENINKDKVLSLTPDDFYIEEDLNTNTEKASLYLCDPTTGERISSPWKLSKIKGDHVKPVNHGGHSRTKRYSSETTYIKTYLSCSEINFAKNFSIGIHIPGIGDFNTSKNGTNTPNRPKGEAGSPFKTPKSLTISTLAPIDYSLPGTVKVSHEDFVTLSEDLGWTSTGFYRIPTEHTSGTCKRRIVYIKPNVLNNNDELKFKDYKLHYDGISNNDVNLCETTWGIENFADKYEKSFDLIQNGANQPFAVIGSIPCGSDYQVNLWFSNCHRIHIEGYFHLYGCTATGYQYRMCPYVKEDYSNCDEKGFVTLLLYKFTLPESNLDRQSGWKDVIRPVKVEVTDNYGNKGTFNLTFNNSYAFDVPSIAF